ncbi:phytanoyl-CoA dioxygenase family protein [Nitratifractor sp.]
MTALDPIRFPEWKRQFDEKGFVLLRNVVDPRRVAMIRDAAMLHLKYRIPPYELESEYIGDESEAYRRTIRRLRQAYDRDRIFREWMEDPSLTPMLQALLGERPVLVLAHHNSIMTKMPHSSTPTHWHRDLRYWHYETDNLLSVWLALGEENERNGVLEFIPGSHRMDLKPDRFDERLFFREDLDANRALIRRRVRHDLEAGDLIFFHAALLHRAAKNTTDHPKISFVYTVRGISNKPIVGTRSDAFGERLLG